MRRHRSGWPASASRQQPDRRLGAKKRRSAVTERGFDGGERRFGLGAVGAAGLRHVAPAAAALAAELFGAGAHEGHRVEPARSGRR